MVLGLLAALAQAQLAPHRFRQRHQLAKIELAIRGWAQRDNAVAKRIKRVDNRRMDYMRSLFGALCSDELEVEVRCLMAYSLFTGTPPIAASHGRRRRADVVKQAQARLLEA